MMTRLHSPAFPLLSDFGGHGGEPSKPDHEAELKAAFDAGYHQGLEEGRGEAEADGELRLAEAKQSFSEQLAEERLDWHRECADLLAARLDGAVHLIERNIEDCVASLLRPWLIERLRERALEDLGKAIARALTEGAKVHIEAPAEILMHLRERLPSDAFQIGYSESGSPDVRAHIENTDIEANISAWIAELEAATS
jgi:hypothetical protein